MGVWGNKEQEDAAHKLVRARRLVEVLRGQMNRNKDAGIKVFQNSERVKGEYGEDFQGTSKTDRDVYLEACDHYANIKDLIFKRFKISEGWTIDFMVGILSSPAEKNQ